MSPSAEELRGHRDVLRDLEHDFRGYVQAQRKMASGYGVDPDALASKRADLLKRAARAQRAVEASGTRLRLLPPPMFGGPVLVALGQQLFAHETSTFNSGEDPFMAADMVLDGLVQALGALDDKVEQAEAHEARHGPVVRTAQRHGPRLWGRIRRLPSGVAVVADVITVIAFVGGW